MSGRNVSLSIRSWIVIAIGIMSLCAPPAVSAQKVEVLHSFSGCAPPDPANGLCLDNDGSRPKSTLVQGSDGFLYGSTAGDLSADNGGTLFKIAPDGTFVRLFTFLTVGLPPQPPPYTCLSGCQPEGSLTYGADGAFYGVTAVGGLYCDGTVFRITSDGSFTRLHDFNDGNASGCGAARGGVVEGLDRKLYGTWNGGGTSLMGIVFRLEPNGSMTTLHNFSGSDGMQPNGDLTLASDGNIYGTTLNGGSCAPDLAGCGTIFRISPTGVVSTVYSFDGTTGMHPGGGRLIQATDGNLYGTTQSTAFRMALDGTVTLVHSFTLSDGFIPTGTLVQRADGSFFGTTQAGGGSNKGTIFRLTPAGNLTVLHDFVDPTGIRPYGTTVPGGLVQATDGHFYGMKVDGGTHNLGYVFRLRLPRAQDGALAVVEDTPTGGTLIATDPNSAPLTFSIVTNGFRGTVAITDTATGAFTYTPNPDANGTDSFTFQVNNGTVDSNVATITVTIDPVNDPLTNGAEHAGNIAAGQIDTWTFTANAGDNITVSIGEVEPTVSFNPWIRLFAPDSSALANSFGSQAAQINQVTATQTGTYTVRVSAHSAFPSGTGGYVLRLARVPGVFAVSPGDQGGYVTIAATHPGEIELGDVDAWQFLAAEGNSVAIDIGEVEPTVSFSPWIRLIGPNGTLVANAVGSVAAQINQVAPATGLYTVLVSAHSAFPQGTGFYNLTVTGVPIINPLSEIAIDFGPGVGLWSRYNQGPRSHQAPSWQLLNGLSPSVMTTARLDGNASDELIATFPGYGVWSWSNNTAWVRVHGFDATQIVAVDLNGNELDELVVNFPGYGVWIRSDTGAWSLLHGLNASRIAAGRFDVGTARDLVLDFPGYGVWLYLNSSTWVNLHALDASQLQVANLDGNAQDDIVMTFPGYGLYVRFNNSSWYMLHGLEPTALAAGNLDDDAGNRQDLILNFAGYGVWAYMNSSTWVQLHAFAASALATRDLDFEGHDDLILNFTGYGVWLLMNNSSFVPLHGLDAEGFVTGRLDPH
jgi:uncharacterized repeat protein (TIGR03803 family)